MKGLDIFEVIGGKALLLQFRRYQVLETYSWINMIKSRINKDCFYEVRIFGIIEKSEFGRFLWLS
jgi:hypothetical protein